MVGLLGLWHLWAVLADQRLSGSDTFVLDLLGLRAAIEHGILEMWITHKGAKGPLPALLSLPILAITGQVPAAARLLSVICHGVLLVQTFALARHLTRDRDVGLWAAAVVATQPMLVGWCRLGYQEPLLAVITVGLLHLTLAVSFRRPVHWFALGLLCGLGLLVKLSMLVFVLVPAGWLLVRRARGKAGVVGVGLAILGAVVVCLGWAVPNAAEIVANFTMSRHSTLPAWLKTLDYLALPGVGPLVLFGMSGAAFCLHRKRENTRNILYLLVFSIVSLGLFFGVFDYWSRYLLPVLPALALLAALGFVQATRGLGDRLRGGAGWTLAVLLLGLLTLAVAGVVGKPSDGQREHGSGMLSPVRRPHSGFVRAARVAGQDGEPVFVVRDSMLASHRSEGVESVWRFRGVDLPIGEMARLKLQLEQHGRVNMVIIRAVAGSGRDPVKDRKLWQVPPGDILLLFERDLALWTIGVKDKTRRLRVTDPDGLIYEAYEIRGGDTPALPRWPGD